MIVFDKRLDMNFYFLRVNKASTGMRPPGGKRAGGKAFVKELHTIQQDGTDGGATKCNPKQGFGWNERCMLLLRLKCRGGVGRIRKTLSHGQSHRPAALSRIRYRNIVE